MHRKFSAEIKGRLSLIGTLTDRYQHRLLFKSINESFKDNTIREYEKNGVEVKVLENKIFPLGQVWLPTNENYLQDFQEAIQRLTVPENAQVLDIGTGSGILSYLFGKVHRKVHILGIDINPDAIRTFEVNSRSLKLSNLSCFEFDVSHQKKF